MKKNIFIIGAGAFGREMESWLELLPDFKERYVIKGYLDDNIHALEGKPSDYRVIGTPLNYNFSENDYVLLTMASPSDRKRIAEGLKGKVNFFTFIAHDVVLGKFTQIGEGAIICSGCLVSANTIIQPFVIINVGSRIGHDCILGAYSSLMATVDIGGNVIVGEKVFFGTKSTVIPGKRIESNITVGAGSVVIKNLTKKGTYFGNPAKLLGSY